MALGYEYVRERQANGAWLIRFPGIPEALTEGATVEEVEANAVDCLLAALEGYVAAGKPLPRPAAGGEAADRATLPSLASAKLSVYEAMRAKGWSKSELARRLGASENSVRRLLNLGHSSRFQAIDEALAKMDLRLRIDVSAIRSKRRAA